MPNRRTFIALAAAAATFTAPAFASGSLVDVEIVDLARGETLQTRRLGTGHGEREYAPTTRTTFERVSDRPDEVVRIRHASHANLVALGVIRARPAQPPTPEPFPPGFVSNPRG